MTSGPSFRICFLTLLLIATTTVAVLGEDYENVSEDADLAALEDDGSLEAVAYESVMVVENGTDAEDKPSEMLSPEKEAHSARLAEDVLACAIESLEEVETYRQVMVANFTVSMTGRSGILFMPLTSVFTDMYLDGRVNLTDPAATISMIVIMGIEEEILFEMEGEMALANESLLVNFTVIEEGVSEGAEMYIINDTAYTKIEGVWTKIEISDVEDLSDLNSSMQDFRGLYEWRDQMAERLRSSEIELVGIEEVEGELCYRLKVESNATTSSEVLEDLEGLIDPVEDIVSPDPSLYQPSETDLDMKETVWISAETYLPKKNSVTGYIIEYIPVDEESDMLVCMNVDVTTKFSDYNKPMDIEVDLPEEARRAILLPSSLLEELNNDK